MSKPFDFPPNLPLVLLGMDGDDSAWMVGVTLCRTATSVGEVFLTVH